MVDLRSDTVTRPTAAMRRAMSAADVGDDAYGEDPTVRRLEEMYAELVGKEAGLFMPSGTMANQASLRVLGRPGTTVLCGRDSHIAAFESGAAGMNAAAQLATLDDSDGMLDLDEVASHVAGGDHHRARPSLVCVEDTAMVAGGVPWDVGRLRAIAALGVAVHMDGARLFNAAAATSTSPRERAGSCTVVWSALSKALCAPMGSVMAADADLVAELRVARHSLGGQQRQVGVVAAAGIVALGEMIDRLPEDHDRASRLAAAVSERWPDCGLDPATVRTNIVVFHHPATDVLLDHLGAAGVLAGTIAPGVVRFVTHHGVGDDDVERALRAIASAP